MIGALVMLWMAACAHPPTVTARGMRPALSTREALQGTLAPQRYAIVIGVDDYVDPAFVDLNYAVDDAASIAEVLGRRDGGFDAVTLLATPEQTTRSSILRTLQAARHAMRPEDVLVVYFSGHGTRLRDGEDWRRFLITADSRSTHLETSAIDLAELQRFFAALPPQRKVLMVDACFNGDGKSAVRPPGEALTTTRGSLIPGVLGSGEAHLFATSPGRPSLEDRALGHGVYTYFVLEALSWGFAEADIDNDEVVTAWEVHDFARGRVIARTGGLQVPEAGLRVVGEADVILAGAPEQRAARENALVYLYPRSDHVLENAELTVDGTSRGGLPGTVSLEPGRHHLAITAADGSVLAEGYTTLDAGQVIRADDLVHRIDGVSRGASARAAVVRSPPLSPSINNGAVGIELSAYRRLARAPGRGQFVALHAGTARTQQREVVWAGAQVGYQADYRRIRYSGGLALSGIWIPPDGRLPEGTDPWAAPEQAGWLFGAMGPGVGLGWKLTPLLTLDLDLRVEGALLPLEEGASPRPVGWVTAGIGIEAAY